MHYLNYVLTFTFVAPGDVKNVTTAPDYLSNMLEP